MLNLTIKKGNRQFTCNNIIRRTNYMNEYFNKIDELISKRETTRYVRKYVENEETLITYWHVGKMLSEAGTKYGEGTIKKWSLTFTKKYGKGYSYRNLRLMLNFYIIYSNLQPLAANLNNVMTTWTNYTVIMSIIDVNKRNYYLNLCIQNNLTKRKLIELIKAKTYESLPFNERNKVIQINDKTNTKIPIKNPIMVNIPEENIKEQMLLKYLIENIENFLKDLGNGYSFIGSEYEIYDESKKYKIDMLLFNYEFNCFTVIELKVRKLQNKDIDQILNYMKIVDKNMNCVNLTRGILITKEDTGYRLSYCRNNNIERTTYLNYYEKL